MKKILSIMTLTVAAVFFSSCTTTTEKASSPAATNATATASPTENVEQVLVKLEHEWADGLVKGDVSVTDRIEADDYIQIGWDGKTLTKAQDLEELKAGLYKPESMNLDNIKVRTFGDVAVVTLAQAEKSQYKGKDSSGRYLFTDVWVKRNGKWQVVAEHGCKVEQPKSQ